MRSDMYEKRQTKQGIKQDFKDKKEVKHVEEMIRKANDISQKDLNELNKNAIDRENFKIQEQKLTGDKSTLKTKKVNNQQRLKEAITQRATFEEFQNIQTEKNTLKNQYKNLKKKITNLQSNAPPKKVQGNADDFHFLIDERKGQAAMDFKLPESSTWNSERILLEKPRRGNHRFTYSGKVEEHDYS